MKNNFIKNLNFKNKVIFIVGGSGLIGKNVVKSLISLNAKVFNLDIKNISIKNKNYNFKYFDCTKLHELESKIDLLVKKFGCPKILINCSYPYTNDWKLSNFESVKLNNMRKNVDIHLNSYAWISKLIADKMKKNKKKGSIINMSSIYGVVGQDLTIYKNTPIKENFTYSIVKGGIVSFTRQMASYYGKDGIRINCISSGGVAGHSAGISKKQNKLFLKNYSTRVPLKRLAKSNEISNVIIFMSSDAASYITGSNIMVDGGWTII